ncbi:MAG: hypothetical protein ACRDYY_04855 [Acidimicrobiales bacterium]
MTLKLEMTVEPFLAGQRGPHVEAAASAAHTAGLAVHLGPFGDEIVGDDDRVISAVADLLRQALEHGATRVSLQVSVMPL